MTSLKNRNKKFAAHLPTRTARSYLATKSMNITYATQKWIKQIAAAFASDKLSNGLYSRFKNRQDTEEKI